MRWIAGLLLMLFLAGWVASEVRLPETSAASHQADSWRLTRNGWLEADWLKPTPVHRPALHPGIVAAFQLLLCLTGLVAFPVLGSRSAHSSSLSSDPLESTHHGNTCPHRGGSRTKQAGHAVATTPS